MILFLTIDRTDEKPVDSATKFDDRESLLAYLGFDKDGCMMAEEDEDGDLHNEDGVGNFDEDELKQLLQHGFVYRDKREIYQMIEIES